MPRVGSILRVLPVVVFVATLVADDTDPSDRWIGAYAWLQTGEHLAGGDRWPLAMGCFIEAHRQMTAIREEAPSFEPDLVNYRIERLEETIAATQEKLSSGEHDLMMKFLDFVESYELGLSQRYENRFAEALDTLDVAKVLLDEIIYENPDEFREAVDTQYTILHESILWLDQQIDFRERARTATYVSDGVEWGTTSYIEE